MLALLVKKENRKGENGKSNEVFSLLHGSFSRRVGGCTCSLLSEGFGCTQREEGRVAPQEPALNAHSHP